MYKVSLGIEHLMTGAQVKSEGLLTFQQESSSIVRVISDKPIEVYWPVYQSFTESEQVAKDCKLEQIRYSRGEAEWWAQVMGEKMRAVETRQAPTAVVKAMRRKFGKDADAWMSKLAYDGLNKCFYFYKDGMYHGVEPDGYIHT